jgi:DNA-binding CsgD family transcriptional regulator
MRALYADARLSSREIAAILGMPERTVRVRLRRYGIKARTRGRYNREDRAIVPSEVLQVLYVELGLTAAKVGQRLGVSGGTVPPDLTGTPSACALRSTVPLPGPEEIELISALYADPLIAAVLTAYGIPHSPPGGSLSERFPEPVPLTTPLVKDLYWGCGTGLNHIELLTGQPAESVRGFMRRAGIPLRQPGGRTPFMRRWRSGPADSARRVPSGRPRQEPSDEGRGPSDEASHAKRVARSQRGDAQ